jgi:hypothetical protein
MYKERPAGREMGILMKPCLGLECTLRRFMLRKHANKHFSPVPVAMALCCSPHDRSPRPLRAFQLVPCQPRPHG